MRKPPTCEFRFGLASVVVAVFCAATAIPSTAQFKTVVNFNGANGMTPEYAPLVQGRDGNLYGTTNAGGANSAGTVFRFSPLSGKLSTIYSFCSQTNCTDGSSPQSGLVLGTDGNFYGTTFAGGNTNCAFPSGCGTVFKITAAGKLTTLHTFVSGDGAGPPAGLVQGTNGNFYGVTGSVGGDGTVFKITSLGKFTTLHNFGGADGDFPFGPLALGTDGNLYGTTLGGGASGYGTIFKITPTGALTTLHSFDLTDGAAPFGGLVQANDGSFYGTTEAGGANTAGGCGSGFTGGCGTFFQLTTGGTFTSFYSFCSQANCADGANPYSTPVQATDGKFYGTTSIGGIGSCDLNIIGCGTIFEITAGGTLSTPYAFCFQAGCADGFYPYAGLVQATNGIFYGTTPYGGSATTCSSGCGTLFKLSVGLGPFVQAVTYSGKVGATIEFLGQGFNSSTTVSFNGTPATITSVKSGTYLTATVPTGATTGFVIITTVSGSLQSNKVFRVIP